MALSTLGPATSPCLSAIRVDFTRVPTTDRSVESLIQNWGGDLRQVATEIARIERGFGEAVDVTVLQLQGSAYWLVLNALGVTVRFPCSGLTFRDPIDSFFNFIPHRFPGDPVVEVGNVEYPCGNEQSTVNYDSGLFVATGASGVHQTVFFGSDVRRGNMKST